MAKQAQNGDTVQVNYTGTLDDGEVFDSSAGRAPLEFTLGQGQVIPGFDQAVVGLHEGESTHVHIPADQAYGPHHEQLVAVVERDQLPPDLPLEVGTQLQMRQEGGHPMIVTITDVTDKTVTLDANHPLAGKDLNFDITLVKVA